jgi:RNA polymerase sigma-70 factor (ECF subfamily)
MTSGYNGFAQRGEQRVSRTLSRANTPSGMPVATAQPAQTDREAGLIARAAAGDREAFYELIHPYERSIYVAALSILQNHADAEDAAQEAIFKALKYLENFRGEAKFSTWLVQITINEARMRLRKNRPHLYESLDEPADTEEGDYMPRDTADWREIPSEALERAELREALQKAIAGLAPKYREVFMLRDVDNLSIAETAQALGITEANVKTRLLRARLQVRDALAPGYDGNWTTGGSWKKVRPW